MMKKEIVVALALGGCLLGTTAFAQDTTAGAAAAPAASSAAASGDDVIHLHMPAHRRVVHAHAAPRPAETAAPTETPSIDSIGADATAPAVTAPVPASTEAPPPPPAKPAKSSPAKKSAPAIPFTFGEDSGTAPPQESASPGSPEAQAATPARETKTASLPPKPEVPKPVPVVLKPVKEAARAKADEHAGLAKRGAVLFDKGKSNPSPQQFDGLKLLAGDLSTALEGGRGPVQLEAYAGARGDKSSGARRLSLERAIAVRQLLIDDGLPSSRIIVRAMGGADDAGPNDRVDVFVRSS